MRKLAVVVLILAVAVMFSVPAFAGSVCGSSTCNKCAKPCPTPCPPKACVTCGQPCNVLQSTANVITSMQAPDLCPKCSTCPKPCNTCPKPCNTCNK